jgi:hypothetical protein
MPTPQQRLTPPPRFGDLGQLEEILWANLPQIASHMAGLFGRRTPRLSKKEVSRQSVKLHRFLIAARPYLLGLWALKSDSDRQQCVYALLEGLLREQFRAGGKKIPPNKDSFAYLLASVEQLARAPNRAWAKSEPYSSAREGMYKFALLIYQQVNPLAVEEILNDWASSNDARKLLQTTIHWPQLTRQFRLNRPKRLTVKAAHQLATEYRTCSSLLEQRLRLLVSLDHAAAGTAKKWAEWQKATLFELLAQAEASPRLNWIPTYIDRHVRNALAHGEPEINLDRQECSFHDRNATVAWEINCFFEKTRHLTLVVRALLEFDSILKFVQTRTLVATLWSGLAVHSQVPSPNA